jgi:hypothetical protein
MGRFEWRDALKYLQMTPEHQLAAYATPLAELSRLSRGHVQ